MSIYKYKCDDCGKEVERTCWKRPGHRRCDECAYKRVAESARQLMSKSGPYYEKWKQGLKKAARRL